MGNVKCVLGRIYWLFPKVKYRQNVKFIGEIVLSENYCSVLEVNISQISIKLYVFSIEQ